jgi:hypothetical protein
MFKDLISGTVRLVVRVEVRRYFGETYCLMSKMSQARSHQQVRRRFRGTYCLYLQGRKVSQDRNQQSPLLQAQTLNKEKSDTPSRNLRTKRFQKQWTEFRTEVNLKKDNKENDNN